jgi:hypothetical protein
VKKWREVGHENPVDLARSYAGIRRSWIVPQTKIDVQAALRAAAEHHWPDHPDQPRPFATLEDAKAVVLSSQEQAGAAPGEAAESP